MGKTAWNDAEDAAMDYLPHVDVVLYLRGIRRRMDYRTGIAGQSEPISYEWLSQIAEVRSERGSTTKVPPRMNKEALRASFARQERAGLIERISESHGRGLVFRCLLADRDQSVSGRNNPRTTPEQPQQNNPGFASNNNDMGVQSDPRATPCCTAMNNPIPESGIREEKEMLEQRADVVPRARRFDCSALPNDWLLFIRHERPDLDPDRTWDGFSRYFSQGEGQNVVRVDWYATWVKWVRREQQVKANGRRSSTMSDFQDAAWAELRRSFPDVERPH